ncbi:MAG TPA: CAP domain-containing protein [Roseiarcus sp.]|nr:CAP domain-containing protein [Roseiarcus sp.]
MRPACAGALIAALCLSACGGGEPLLSGPIAPDVARRVAAVRLDPAAAAKMLTAYRAGHGLGAVRLDPALTAMAQRQADAMVAANELSHDVAGGFTARVLAAGLDTPRAAENLGGGYYSLEEAFTGWRHSPEHNANLLMPQATRFGIAIAKDPRTHLRVYWAMELAAEPEKPARGEAAGLISTLGGAVVANP